MEIGSHACHETLKLLAIDLNEWNNYCGNNNFVESWTLPALHDYRKQLRGPTSKETAPGGLTLLRCVKRTSNHAKWNMIIHTVRKLATDP